MCRLRDLNLGWLVEVHIERDGLCGGVAFYQSRRLMSPCIYGNLLMGVFKGDVEGEFLVLKHGPGRFRLHFKENLSNGGLNGSPEGRLWFVKVIQLDLEHLLFVRGVR